ncbi:MAG: hypothetical protein J0I10_01745 [Verrucomicrobia bacterium]|nr:hypothetical protein [Verrucomicrobiota bacterium]
MHPFDLCHPFFPSDLFFGFHGFLGSRFRDERLDGGEVPLDEGFMYFLEGFFFRGFSLFDGVEFLKEGQEFCGIHLVPAPFVASSCGGDESQQGGNGVSSAGGYVEPDFLGAEGFAEAVHERIVLAVFEVRDEENGLHVFLGQFLEGAEVLLHVPKIFMHIKIERFGFQVERSVGDGGNDGLAAHLFPGDFSDVLHAVSHGARGVVEDADTGAFDMEGADAGSPASLASPGSRSCSLARFGACS